MNSGWKFAKIPTGSELAAQDFTSENFDDSGWENVSLPHTFNAEDGASGSREVCEGGEGYYRGLGCYRRKFAVPLEKIAGKYIFLEFDGANTMTEVYVNSFRMGGHKGGYSAFRVNITPIMKFLTKDGNILAVKVSNAPTDSIAPITDQGDFTKMGGLYRGVRLVIVNSLRIAMWDYGSTGVYITPKNISPDSAYIDIDVGINGNSDNLRVTAEIFDMNNNKAAEGEYIFDRISKSNTAQIKTQIARPHLWDGVNDPYLYSAEITLFSGDVALDKVKESFGIREYHIDREKGFFLNGRAYPLRGVNYHQDSYENGWAMTREQRVRDYEMIRDMGCTAVRMCHYQHSREEYEICDRLGICVWSEIGIVNKMSARDDLHVGLEFENNACQQLIEMIEQNYNHPSVVVWGLSNELHQMSDEIFELYKELHRLAGSLDSSRLTVYADNQFYGRFLQLPAEAVGYNRYFGWYKDAGEAGEFGKWLDVYHNDMESRPICVSEYGGGGAISQHKDNIDWKNDIDPWGTPHYENYQSALHEEIWAQLSERQYLWGTFIWCMFDFASNGRREGDTVGQNDKGLATRERIPKDAYYFYRSVWSSEKTVHITEKRHNPRACDVPFVKVYSNAREVELFVNGASVGRLSRDELRRGYESVFMWNGIKLDKGCENEVIARAWFEDGSTGEDKVCWVGE